MSFDPGFRFHTVDPAGAGWETLDTMREEASAELDERTRLYPALIRKGRLARDVADRELRVWRSIVDELTPGALVRGRAHATWTEQVHALRREIALRRTLYPRWIEARRLDADLAARRLAIVESIHDMWWHGDWRPEAVAARAETVRDAA